MRFPRAGKSDRGGFTLIELMVVLAMMAILMASLTAAVRTAMRESRISKATAEVREITHAILAYENAEQTHRIPTMNRMDATEQSLSFILGKGNDSDGNKLPVFYEAAVDESGRILDPWGTPYRVTVKESDVRLKEKSSKITSATFIPNFYRLDADDESREGDK